MITLALRSCLRPPHQTKPCLQPAVIRFNPVVGIPIGAMPRRRQQLLQHDRVGARVVGDDLHRGDLRRDERPLEEPAGSGRIAPWGDEHVDDLAELVDGTVDAPPPSATFT
jgi:hypothetical protein